MKRGRRWGWGALLCAIAAVSTVSCGDPPLEAPLLVGTNVWPGYEPLYLARSDGAYDRRQIRFVEYSSATQVLRAIRNGTVQVAALTLDEALTLRSQQVPIRVILVTDVSNGADALVARPTVARSIQELRGRRIGVEATAVGAFLLTRALETVGLTRDDVVVAYEPSDHHEEAFTAGDVDAVVTFDPARSRLVSRGAIQLFDSSRIPNEVVDVLVAREEAIEERPEALRRLLAGWFEALHHLEQDPDDAAALMAPRLGLAPDAVLASYEALTLGDATLNERELGADGSPPALEVTARRLASFLVEADLLAREVDVAGFVDAAPLRAARRREER